MGAQQQGPLGTLLASPPWCVDSLLRLLFSGGGTGRQVCASHVTGAGHGEQFETSAPRTCALGGPQGSGRDVQELDLVGVAGRGVSKDSEEHKLCVQSCNDRWS